MEMLSNKIFVKQIKAQVSFHTNIKKNPDVCSVLVSSTKHGCGWSSHMTCLATHTLVTMSTAVTDAMEIARSHSWIFTPAVRMVSATS